MPIHVLSYDHTYKHRSRGHGHLLAVSDSNVHDSPKHLARRRILCKRALKLLSPAYLMSGIRRSEVNPMDHPRKVKNLVLDSGPLLSLTPLRDLAEKYLTVPQVLDELKDKKAREHLERLSITAGINIEIRNPSAAALAQVISVAKKTGDYSVLSQADISVLALTYALAEEAKKSGDKPQVSVENAPPTTGQIETLGAEAEPVDEVKTPTIDDLTQELQAASITPKETDEKSEQESFEDSSDEQSSEGQPFFDDPPSEDDGEGEWITPTNVAMHKSRALFLVPDSGPASRGKNQSADIEVGCMTADFAMQNVLLHMDLNLIDVEGKQISHVKTWVLRCHACFKICKDSSKRFCPACGGATLLRASVTLSAPQTPGGEPTMQIHLKKNFQWRLRGTKYSIPSPKPGSAKNGSGEGLILRGDQPEWVRAEKRMEGRRMKEEKKLTSALNSENDGVRLDWMDPDWMPEMLTVGAGGKGRNMGKDGMPVIGYGRKNPNERRRYKR